MSGTSALVTVGKKLLLIILLVVILSLCFLPGVLVKGAGERKGKREEKKTISVSREEFSHIEQELQTSLLVPKGMFPPKKGEELLISSPEGEELKVRVTSSESFPDAPSCLHEIGFKSLFPLARSFMEALSLLAQARKAPGELRVIKFVA